MVLYLVSDVDMQCLVTFDLITMSACSLIWRQVGNKQTSVP